MTKAVPGKTPFDLAEYTHRVRGGRCFICAFVSGDPGYQHHTVYEDGATVAFLNRYPTLLGHCLVAPKAHLESWVHDLPEGDFLRFQAVVRTVARALAATLPTERMYSLSLGSQQGNAHLHWHLAPLPPGVPYHEQQYHALMTEHGVLDLDDAAQAALAERIRAHI